MDQLTTNVEPALQREIVAHYERALDAMSTLLDGTPFIAVFLPEGLDGPPTRAGQLHHPVPAKLPTIPVTTRSGAHRYLAVTINNLLWRAHGYAVGFETWAPTARDPGALAYARVIVVPEGATPRKAVVDAARRIRAELQRRACDAFVLLDGVGLTLWIPFADAPRYPDVRLWLHDVVEACEFMADSGVRVSVRTNAPGLGSAIPYSLQPTPELPIVAPIRWGALDSAAVLTFEHSAALFANFDDVIAEERKRIGALRFADQFRRVTAMPIIIEAGPAYEYMPRSQVITVAIDILSDGKPRTAQQILDEAIARDLLAKTVPEKYVYTMLKAYFERTSSRGREPEIIQDADRRFRINRPADDWPEPLAARPWPDHTKLIARLHDTSKGDDPSAFELTVCDAFAALGFAPTHIGGNDAPDGYVDAILGPLGYRSMIECKTSKRDMQRPDIYEAAKYREQYHAQYAAIVGPAFGDTRAIIEECRNHGVCAWSVGDLEMLLRDGGDPWEMRVLFAPGVVADHLTDLLWQRAHGEAKRVRVVCDAIRAAGWEAQKTAVTFDEPDQAPLITEDAALLLVDEHLKEAGAHLPATRAEVRDAFAYLTNPYVGEAAWVDDARTAIVVRRAPG